MFSVPETERAKRHTLRSQLAALGFGSAAARRMGRAGTPVRADRSRRCERHELAGYVDLFRAEYLAFGDIAEHARDWWDLDAIGARLPGFIDAYEPWSQHRIDRSPPGSER